MYDDEETETESNVVFAAPLVIGVARVRENWSLVVVILKDAFARGTHSFGAERLHGDWECSGLRIDERPLEFADQAAKMRTRV
jgi:hypothetical protein